MHRSRNLAALILFCLASGLVSAQESEERQSEQELSLRATEIVFVEGSLPFVPASSTIAAKLPVPLALTPANVGVVTRALLDEQYARVAGDALRNVSNVNVQPGFGVHDYFVVRGFDSLSSGLVLVDGAPEPEVTYYQLYNVELVEMLKGPGGFLYGSNPLAGTVNLVRKQPLRGRALQLGAAFGSFDTVEGTLDGNWGNDRFGARLNGLLRRSDSWRGGKEAEVVGLNPSVSWQPHEAHRLVANFEYLDVRSSPDAGIPLLFGAIAPVDPGNDYNSSLDRSEQDVHRFQVDYQGELGAGITLRDKFYVRKLDWLSDGTLINGAVPGFAVGLPTAEVLVLRSLVQLDDSQSLVGNQLEAVASFDTGGVKHDVLAGFEVTHYSDSYVFDVGALPPVTLVNPADDSGYVLPIPGQRAVGSPRSTTLAPYVIDQIGLSRRFQVLAGVRFDSIDFEDAASGRERRDSEWSPMVGAVWAPSESMSIYGNWSRSFAPPSARAVESLEPERSEQLEAGVKLSLLDGRARATAAVYRIDRDNIAIPDDNGFTQQLGNQRSTGIELDIAAELRSGLHGTVSYAYNDAELTRFSERVFVFDPAIGFVPAVIDRSGNRPAFAPRHLFGAWLSQTFDMGLGVALGARYVGSQYIAEDNAFELPDAFVLAGQVAYTWKRIRASVNVENILDGEVYQRGFGAQSVIPGAPLSAYARIAVDF